MAVKKKTTKKKVAKKVTKKKKSSEVETNENRDAVIDSINNSSVDDAGLADNGTSTSEVIDEKKVEIDESELTPTVSADSQAIQKTKSKKAKGRPMKRSASKSKKSDKTGIVDDTITQMLKPDALKTIITIANNRLREAGSIWAMPDGECDDMANAIIGVVDKYFPELDQWSVEAVFILTASIYAIPRFMMMKQSKVEAPKTEPVKEAEPELKKAPPVDDPKSSDARLDKYN